MKKGIGYSVGEVANMLGYSYTAVAKNSEDIRQGRPMSISKRNIKIIQKRLEKNKKAITYPYPSRKKIDYAKVKKSIGFSFLSANMTLGKK